MLHGHTAYLTVKFKNTPTAAEILERWENFGSPDSRMSPARRDAGLPSSPRKLIHYLPAPDRPQPVLDVMTENGMAVSIGQLKIDNDQLVSFTGLSHNLILGAAGGAVLATEAAVARELVYRRISTRQVSKGTKIVAGGNAGEAVNLSDPERVEVSPGHGQDQIRRP